MNGKNATSWTNGSSIPFLNFGQTQAAAAMQKELLEAYEQTSRVWRARVQSEVVLWSGLATKLAATRSVPEACEAYTKCILQQLQMNAEDAKRLSDDYQRITQKLLTVFDDGRPSAST